MPERAFKKRLMHDKARLVSNSSYACKLLHFFSNFASLVSGHGGIHGVLKSYSNLMEEEDDNDDETFHLSKLSVDNNDDDTLDDDTFFGGIGGAKSVTFGHTSVRSAKSHQSATAADRSRSVLFGAALSKPKGRSSMQKPMCALPYIIDYWHDRRPQHRASIQIHMLSLSDKMLERVTYRVSSNQKEFVLTLPLSSYMGDPKKAFETYVLEGIEHGTDEHRKILEWHPKATSCRLHVSDLRSSSVGGSTMEFRIPSIRQIL